MLLILDNFIHRHIFEQVPGSHLALICDLCFQAAHEDHEWRNWPTPRTHGWQNYVQCTSNNLEEKLVYYLFNIPPKIDLVGFGVQILEVLFNSKLLKKGNIILRWAQNYQQCPCGFARGADR